MSQNLNIFIVIVQYNQASDTLACLKSLESDLSEGTKIIVVDNDSNEPDRKAVADYSLRNGNIKFIETGKNLGYTGGNNAGIKYALENGADYIFILNNDTIIKPGTVRELVNYAKNHPKIGIVSPGVDELGAVFYGGKIYWFKPELEHNYNKNGGPLKSKNTYLSGVALMVKKEVFNKIGMFDDRFFLYFEDVDFSVRARKEGYDLAVDSSVSIMHNISRSAGKLGSPKILRYHYRNSHLFNSKHAPIYIRWLLPFWSLSIIIRQAVKIILSKNTAASRAILQGVFDYYRGKFGIIS
ncbi:MAG: glycosyl transferase family protein [Parcubacteria group bacterium Licking1014_17]|nr:MAG: glycosyl transferase family protein [Parcubacteria group bacterium Licking1014_17]